MRSALNIGMGYNTPEGENLKRQGDWVETC